MNQRALGSISAVCAAVKALLLAHESVGVLVEFFAELGMPLQVLLQRGVAFDELLVVDQRRIFAQLLSEVGLAVEEAVETRKLARGEIRILIGRRGGGLRLGDCPRNPPEHAEECQPGQPLADQSICAFHESDSLLSRKMQTTN